MTLRSSFAFAMRMIFPKTEKKSSARKSLFGSVACIAISIVPLVVVLSVSDGMISGMTDRIIGLSSSHLSAYVRSDSDYLKSAESFYGLACEMGQVEGVVFAYPEINLTALAAGSSYRTGAQVRAVSPDVFQDGKTFSSFFEVKDGDKNVFLGGGRNAIIGSRLSELLNIKAGDTFRLISLAENPRGGFSVRTLPLNVAAVVSSGYQELDALWVFISVETAYASLPLANATSIVRIETDDAFSPSLERIAQDIRHVTFPEANIYRWDEINADQFANFSSTRVMLVFIMMLIVLIASVNISAALVMLVMERRREIAIIKSIGGSSGGVMLSFIVVGGAAGLGGVVLGMPLGIACAINCNKIVSFAEMTVNFCVEFFYAVVGADVTNLQRVQIFNPEYYLAEIPADVTLEGILIIAVMTLVLSLVVSVIPAYRAGKERPLETLRKS